MFHSRRLVAVMATLAALVAVPATASASTANAKPTKASVTVSVNKAEVRHQAPQALRPAGR